ncbi:Isonitrile hydratase [Colletotrichum orbiculare MAFF 240422]|uniref:Isonitrile hydratase n=1 Tax=Colletotrichum orbiculare (strain 104-T / ATCC 96160 / CBS 514.97 / LARS 414 / MAFF 240422) TaxID=1213857 RepID=N4VTF2_COLOR|nr:Isonitrile hydratase [Colletotrichum orbiculare MAFF 240422]
MSFDLSNPNRKIHAGVILTKGMLNLPKAMHVDALELELHWVTEDGSPAKMKSGALLQPTDTFETCPPLDIAFMGAHDASYKTGAGELSYIRKTYAHCGAFLTIYGGVIPLLEPGLVVGKTATCPRPYVELLRKSAPVVNGVDRRWARDGKIWTSNSLLNGTDLVRAFAIATWGGRTGLIEALLDTGHYPDRNVDFEDFYGHHYVADQDSKCSGCCPRLFAI